MQVDEPGGFYALVLDCRWRESVWTDWLSGQMRQALLAA